MINSLFLVVYVIILLVSNIKSEGRIEQRLKEKIAKELRARNDSCNHKPQKRNSTELSFVEDKECGLFSPSALCLKNGDRVFLPSAVPKGLIGHWGFDEVHPLDSSRFKNHATQRIKAGPGFGGLGSSGFFTNGNYLTIPSKSEFNANEFTITFFMFVIEDSYLSSKGSRFCPIIQRGNDDLFNKQFHRSPALYYDRKNLKLKLYLKTTDLNNPQGESLLSNSIIVPQRWLHITIKQIKSSLMLYINGILDSSITLVGVNEVVDSPLYIGNVPWLQDQCSYPFLLDEVRYYNTPKSEDYIQAEASPVLGGIQPNFLQLGCMSCNIKEAGGSCKEGYRLCSSIELHTGGYQIARSLGWITPTTHIWTHAASEKPDEFNDIQGLGLCCAEIK